MELKAGSDPQRIRLATLTGLSWENHEDGGFQGSLVPTAGLTTERENEFNLMPLKRAPICEPSMTQAHDFITPQPTTYIHMLMSPS